MTTREVEIKNFEDMLNQGYKNLRKTCMKIKKELDAVNHIQKFIKTVEHKLRTMHVEGY